MPQTRWTLDKVGEPASCIESELDRDAAVWWNKIQGEVNYRLDGLGYLVTVPIGATLNSRQYGGDTPEGAIYFAYLDTTEWLRNHTQPQYQYLIRDF